MLVTTSHFDRHGRFILSDYTAARPFASFLPGIAGPLGIPLWAFYVNRGQAIASFGVRSKDTPILEFQPANKAYQLTPYLGFRTFLKINAALYEPFSSFQAERHMAIGMNELELQEVNHSLGLQTNVVYFTVPNDNFAGLVRQVTVQNISANPIDLEILDGLPAVSPHGLNNAVLKEIGRTVEAWMEVFNHTTGVPFYRLRASVADSTEVETFEAGHFALAFAKADLLPALVDVNVVFGQNTALSTPDRFGAARRLHVAQHRAQSLVRLLQVHARADDVEQPRPRTDFEREPRKRGQGDEVRGIANEMPLQPQVRFAVAARIEVVLPKERLD